MSDPPKIGEKVEWMNPFPCIAMTDLTIHKIEGGMIQAHGYEATAMGSEDIYVQTDAAGWDVYRRKAWETRAMVNAMRRSR